MILVLYDYTDEERSNGGFLIETMIGFDNEPPKVCTKDEKGKHKQGNQFEPR